MHWSQTDELSGRYFHTQNWIYEWMHMPYDCVKMYVNNLFWILQFINNWPIRFFTKLWIMDRTSVRLNSVFYDAYPFVSFKIELDLYYSVEYTIKAEINCHSKSISILVPSSVLNCARQMLNVYLLLCSIEHQYEIACYWQRDNKRKLFAFISTRSNNVYMGTKYVLFLCVNCFSNEKWNKCSYCSYVRRALLLTTEEYTYKRNLNLWMNHVMPACHVT